MSRELFLKIVDDITDEEDWFKESVDAAGRKSFSPLQKCTAAIRQLAYSNVPDTYDESLAMSARECLDMFCKVVIKRYSREFLRKPISHDISLIYQAHEQRHHLPGMLGSLDCTHWAWRACPTALRGQYHRGDHEYPTVMLEAVATCDCWIWHSYFGLPGSNNDINVLHQSALFLRDKKGIELPSAFTVSGHAYRRGYYFVIGIYPPWSTLVKAYAYPTGHNEKISSKLQSAARNDVERAFGILKAKAKWQLFARPARATSNARLDLIMYACIILHNMVLKDEGNAISPVYIPDPPIEPNKNPNYIHDLRNEETHYRLRADLVQHIDSLNLDIQLDDD